MSAEKDCLHCLFKVGETLIYSATYDGVRYIAASIVRPIDLQAFHGNLTLLDVGGKFGHVTVTGRNIKIFVPFSARFQGGFWFGSGAVLEKVYSLNVFRQEEAHGCKYVAWSLSEGRGLNNLPPQHMDTAQQTSTMKKLGAPNAIPRSSERLSLDFIKGHMGIIYSVSDEQTVFACSPTTQLIYFPASMYQDWMKPGRFITFDARTESESSNAKLLGTSLEDEGAVSQRLTQVSFIIVLSALSLLQHDPFHYGDSCNFEQGHDWKSRLGVE